MPEKEAASASAASAGAHHRGTCTAATGDDAGPCANDYRDHYDHNTPCPVPGSEAAQASCQEAFGGSSGKRVHSTSDGSDERRHSRAAGCESSHKSCCD
jgi:hypothetical protein